MESVDIGRLAAVSALLLAGCDLTLTPELDTRTVEIRQVDCEEFTFALDCWPEEMVVGDTARIGVWLREVGDTLSHFPVAAMEWTSSDRFALEIVEVDSVGTGNSDALFARVAAISPGRALIRVQLPDSDVLLSAEPFEDSIVVRENWAILAAGGDRTCAIPEGRFRAVQPPVCWGEGTSGALGTGRFETESLPTFTKFPDDLTNPELGPPFGIGDEHTCVVLNFTAYCSGSNDWGQLGLGTTVASADPAAVAGGDFYVSIAAGSRHTCASSALSGLTHCWGHNGYGQLGTLFASDECPATGASECSLAPELAFSFNVLRKLAAGDGHTCGWAVDETVHCWGSNEYGQLGTGSALLSSAFSEQVVGDLIFSNVTAGRDHACGLTVGERIYCWGRNDRGQLGTGSGAADTCGEVACSRVPIEVAGGLRFTHVAAGGYTTCGIVSNGSAYCWGANDSGQLGSGFSPESCHGVGCSRLPRLVFNVGLKYVDLAVGSSHVCGRTVRNELYCWGANDKGQLGVGVSGGAVSEPVRALDPVPTAGSTSAARSTTAGASATAVRRSGSVPR